MKQFLRCHPSTLPNDSTENSEEPSFSCLRAAAGLSDTAALRNFQTGSEQIISTDTSPQPLRASERAAWSRYL